MPAKGGCWSLTGLAPPGGAGLLPDWHRPLLRGV